LDHASAPRNHLLLKDLLQKENESLKAELRRRDEGAGTPPAEAEIYRVLLLSMLHDLNNAMESIRISAGLLSKGALPPEDLPQMYQGIGDAAERAAALVQRVFTYIDEAPVLSEIADVGAIVRDVVGEFRREVPAKVRITVPRGKKGTIHVRTNPFFLRLVLHEIFRNAAHALNQTGGAIRVQVQHDQEHVRITVRDTGPGVPAHVLEHLQAVRLRRTRNLGSGLPLSLRLMQAMEGDLVVDSVPGKPTAVTVSLRKVNR
jgi:signal transduction histidine kinase